MTPEITKNWRGGIDYSSTRKLTQGFKTRNTPLKDRVHSTIHRLKIQSVKMEELASKIKTHDKRLFQKCIESQVANDPARAAMYAAECGELRKIAKTALTSHLALEKIILRLETIMQYGDIAAEMKPVSQAVNMIKDKISGILPNLSFELSEVAGTLQDTYIDLEESPTLNESSEPQTEESKRILKEAALIAEQRIQNHFPDLPTQKRSLEDLSES